MVASFLRPPLGRGIGFFVIVHVLGNPINTIQCLLLKLAICQRSAAYWRDYHPKFQYVGIFETICLRFWLKPLSQRLNSLAVRVPTVSLTAGRGMFRTYDVAE